VDAELDAVAAGLRAGHSLPARWYADPALWPESERLVAHFQARVVEALRTG
jgi:hypothetical protein